MQVKDAIRNLKDGLGQALDSSDDKLATAINAGIDKNSYLQKCVYKMYFKKLITIIITVHYNLFTFALSPVCQQGALERIL